MPTFEKLFEKMRSRNKGVKNSGSFTAAAILNLINLI